MSLTSVYIVGMCPCGGRIIVPELTNMHFKPHPPICEASGMEMCTRVPPSERKPEPPPPPKRFIMETR